MKYTNDPALRRTATRRAVSGSADVDVGLRAYMLRVYNYMGLAIALTGLVSYFIGSNIPLAQTLYSNPMSMMITLFLPLGLGLWFNFRIHKLSYQAAHLLFWCYAGSLGVALGVIFLVYTGESIARVFFITSATFGAMSLYGYTTQRDLTAFGSFLMMGLFGIIIGSLVNFFMKSSAFSYILSMVGVLVFTGLTAYYTQMIRQAYLEDDDHETMGKKALMGACMLYISFVNLFLSLLRLFGDRR